MTTETTQQSHTPLPWQVYVPRDEPPVIKSTRDLPSGQRITEWIGTIHGSAGWDAERNEANANLIVTAVNERPALLARMARMKAAIEVLLKDQLEDCGEENCDDCKPWRQLRAALTE